MTKNKLKKQSNPVAKELRTEKFKIKVLPNKKKLSELSLEEIKKVYKDLDKKVLIVLDVKNSMNTKKSYGGTSEVNVKSMIKKYKKEIK